MVRDAWHIVFCKTQQKNIFCFNLFDNIWNCALFTCILERPAVPSPGSFCLTPWCSVSVLSKKILHWANICFSARAIARPCGHTTSEAFQALKGFEIYVHGIKILNVTIWRALEGSFTTLAHLGENTAVMSCGRYYHLKYLNLNLFCIFPISFRWGL